VLGQNSCPACSRLPARMPSKARRPGRRQPMAGRSTTELSRRKCNFIKLDSTRED